MKLLIITQVIDDQHPVLGFFSAWVARFAADYEQITVICLEQGRASLPKNVRVLSLGKEQGTASPLVYATRFVRHLAAIEGEYDRVLVHMNPEYFLIAGWWWKLRRRFTALWYVHQHAGFRFKIAEYFADRLFFTSPYGAAARSKKSVRMPAGIDTAVFAPRPVEKRQGSIYFQGRVAPAKRVHVLLGAVRRLVHTGIPVTATIVGPHDAGYVAGLMEEFKDLFDAGLVTMPGPVPHARTPELFSSHTVSVNLTAFGNYDKTVLESVACGTPAVVSSPAFAPIVGEQWVMGEGDEERLAGMLGAMLALAPEAYEELRTAGRTRVEAQESLAMLAVRLKQELAGLQS